MGEHEPQDLTSDPQVRALLADVRRTLPVGGPWPYGSMGAVVFRELGGRELVVLAGPGIVSLLPLTPGMQVYEPHHARRLAAALAAAAGEANARLRGVR